MDTLDPKNLLEKLDDVFDTLKYAATLNLVLGYVLKNIDDGSCRYYKAHENNTLLERFKLEATREDLTKVKSLLSNTDIIETCKKTSQHKIKSLAYKESTRKQWQFMSI